MKRRAELLYPQTSNKQNKNVKHQIKNVIAVDFHCILIYAVMHADWSVPS